LLRECISTNWYRLASLNILIRLPMISHPFTAGPRLSDIPGGDPATQAVASLRGYAYQLYVSTLEWIDLKPDELLYLEVAKDYAVAADDALRAVEVKDTPSATVTINSQGVLDTIDHFVDLIDRNPEKRTVLRFLCTAQISIERKKADRAGGVATLEYWRRAAAGADAGPLRKVLKRTKLSRRAREFIESRNDDALRKELLQRIHWDCGQPEFDAVAQELDGALIRYGVLRLGAHAAEKDRLQSAALVHVLRTIVQQDPAKRCLSAVDLEIVLEQATAVVLRRPDFESLIRAAVPHAAAASLEVAPSVFELERDIPMPSALAARPEYTAKLLAQVRSKGAIAITGSTGSGKTMIARQIARLHGGQWHLLDLRDFTGTSTVQRLEYALSSLGSAKTDGIIIDDFNAMEEPAARRAASRFLSALRRRDALCVVTAYNTPSNRAVVELGLDKSSCISAAELNVEQVGEIIASVGGDRAKWSRAVHGAGAFGHPQLVMALVSGLVARFWPEEELRSLRSFSRSADVEEERLATRRRLFDALPSETALLLYRTSLLIGRFERSLALALGELPAPVTAPGAKLDRLIGPWIEQVGGSELRMSPLLQNAGQETLAPSEQRAVHHAAAEHIVGGHPIPVDKVDAAFLHSLLGKSESALAALAYAAICATPDQRRLIGEWSSGMRLLRFDRPIYPENLALSILLRLAQFRLAADQNTEAFLTRCWQTLRSEIGQLPDRASRDSTEFMALAMVLVESSAAGLLPDWIDLVLRFQKLVDADPERQASMRRVNEPLAERRESTTPGMLFMLQVLGTRSVASLLATFQRLDRLTPTQRSILFADALNTPSDFALVVNRAWLEEHQRSQIDAPACADAYRQMAMLAQGWGYRELALRCHVARSIMLDEYGANPDAALEALQEGNDILGDDPLLGRARAKILYRRKDHAGALELLRDAAHPTGLDDPVERAFMLREAGISAAETGHWEESGKWLAAAAKAADDARSPEMKVMATGLRADAAIAAFKVGDANAAISGLCDVLDELSHLDPTNSRKAGYCHRVVRHAVLWLFSQSTHRPLMVDDEPPALLPGMCSNPEPPDVKDMPVGALDYAYYLLAQADISLGGTAGMQTRLRARLGARGIPAMECILAHSRIESALRHQNVDAFIEQLPGWVDAQIYLHANGARRSQLEMVEPSYGEVRRATANELTNPPAVMAVEDALLSFASVAAVTDRGDLIDTACSRIRNTPFANVACHVASVMSDGKTPGARLEDHAASSIHRVASQDGLTPRDLFLTAIRLVEYAKHSNFGDVVRPSIARWVRSTWSKVIVEQRFLLRRAAATVPDIERALAEATDDLASAGQLLLAAAPAVGVNLAEELRAELKAL
jgi:hypothetical protein